MTAAKTSKTDTTTDTVPPTEAESVKDKIADADLDDVSGGNSGREDPRYNHIEWIIKNRS